MAPGTYMPAEHVTASLRRHCSAGLEPRLTCWARTLLAYIPWIIVQTERIDSDVTLPHSTPHWPLGLGQLTGLLYHLQSGEKKNRPSWG